jgi:hypothetical protein
VSGSGCDCDRNPDHAHEVDPVLEPEVEPNRNAGRDPEDELTLSSVERALALYTDTAMVDAYERAFARTLGHPFPGSGEPAETI